MVVWDWAVGNVAAQRDAVARGAVLGLQPQPLHARVFAWMTLGDDRNVAATYVAGALRHTREACARPEEKEWSGSC